MCVVCLEGVHFAVKKFFVSKFRLVNSFPLKFRIYQILLKGNWLTQILIL